MGPLDQWACHQGYERVVGVDEAGRGPLAGPVVAAAVLLPLDHGLIGLADSKKISAKKREQLAPLIKTRALAFGVAVIGPRKIEATDIRQASLEAMSQAFLQLLSFGVVPDLVLVDGCDVFPEAQTNQGWHMMSAIKADLNSEIVGAASILAKVHRDALMQDFHHTWPHYGFDKHMGYPTKAHKEAILKYGPCSIHRHTFRGVRPK